MGRIIGIVIFGILNVMTLLISFMFLWLIQVGLSFNGGLSSFLIGLLIFIVVVGVEVIKWMSFYQVIKRKKTKWIIFYGVYGGLILIFFLIEFMLHLFFLIPIFYAIGIFLVSSSHKKLSSTLEIDPTDIKFKTDDLHRETTESPKKDKNIHKSSSLSFQIELLLFIPAMIVLSYYVYANWSFYMEYSYTEQSIVSRIFRNRAIFETTIAVLSWAVYIQLCRKINSNWRYLFILPMAYQAYFAYRYASILLEVNRDILEIILFPPVYLNVLSVILYVLGISSLHRKFYVRND